MRERVDASKLTDLDSLLQRDLNDFRVATELVPYLKGEKHGPVAFFPSILAVLIPKGFIEGEDTAYPRVEPNGDQTLVYGNRWKLQRFGLEGGNSPFGLLSVYPAETDIIVLDGQHRASAFRHVSGVFEGAQSGIYSAFYQNEEPARHFTADLPVTLIWFASEEDEEVEPTFVSRNLFIDVNSNAQAVSESRSILLNDREVLPETIGGSNIRNWAEEYRDEVEQLFSRAGLDLIEADYSALAREIIEKKVEG